MKIPSHRHDQEGVEDKSHGGGGEQGVAQLILALIRDGQQALQGVGDQWDGGEDDQHQGE